LASIEHAGVDEVGRNVATVKLQTLNYFQLVVQSLAILYYRQAPNYDMTEVYVSLIISSRRYSTAVLTFTVMTPLRPTFFMALEIMLPISSSPLAEIVAT
jgi:hypothetical protein